MITESFREENAAQAQTQLKSKNGRKSPVRPRKEKTH